MVPELSLTGSLCHKKCNRYCGYKAECKSGPGLKSAELQKSCPSAPLSIIRLAASRIAGINGKLRAVFGLMDNAYYNRIAAAREISTYAHPGIDCITFFFLFFHSYSLQWNIFIFVLYIFRFKDNFEVQIPADLRSAGYYQSTNSSCYIVTSFIYKIVRHLPFIKHNFFDRNNKLCFHLIHRPDPFKPTITPLFLQQHFVRNCAGLFCFFSVHR